MKSPRWIKATLFLAALSFMIWQVQLAPAQDDPPSPRDKAKEGEVQSPRHHEQQPSAREKAREEGIQSPRHHEQQSLESGPDLAGAYAELRELGRQYKEARAVDAKQRIQQRAEELMSQIFDAKVQKEQRRIEAQERRLNTEKEMLREKQMHKQDLVHQGVQRFFDTGEPPEWATSREE